MKLATAIVATLIAAASALAPGGEGIARADTPPSAWDRAKDPGAGDAYALHISAIRDVMTADVARQSPQGRPFADVILRRLRLKLERFGAETHSDVRLRFDLADVYQKLGDSEPPLLPRAAAIVRSALALSPNHPMALHALMTLAFACGKIPDHVCERDAYVDVLRRTDERTHTYLTANLNLAETEMHLGDLRSAIEGYRETFRIASQLGIQESVALATWGLAVALDRSGEKVAAEREALLAVERDRGGDGGSIIHSPDVFFVPDYEIHYYEGLAHAARARQATSPRAARDLWKGAEKHFGTFVSGAEAAKDRWLPHAKARLREAKAERERAEKRVPSERVRPGADEDVTL